MPTLREVLLSQTALLDDGEYTFKEHFESFANTVTARKARTIEIAVVEYPVEVSSATVQVAVENKGQSAVVENATSRVSVDNTSVSQIVIDTSN